MDHTLKWPVLKISLGAGLVFNSVKNGFPLSIYMRTRSFCTTYMKLDKMSVMSYNAHECIKPVSLIQYLGDPSCTSTGIHPATSPLKMWDPSCTELLIWWWPLQLLTHNPTISWIVRRVCGKSNTKLTHSVTGWVVSHYTLWLLKRWQKL